MLVVGVGLWMKFADVADGDNFPPAPTDPLKLNDYEIELFREYLRIPSVHPNIDYSKRVLIGTLSGNLLELLTDSLATSKRLFREYLEAF